MMELGRILEGLVQRTAEGRLRWSRTVENNRFVASVDVISVAIVDEGLIRLGDYESLYQSYRLDIFDEAGDIVESYGIQDTNGDQNQLLERLYVLARRAALDVDSVLEKLARGLEI